MMREINLSKIFKKSKRNCCKNNYNQKKNSIKQNYKNKNQNYFIKSLKKK